MEITVLSEEENPMLHRTDVRFRVSHVEATPDRLAIRDSLAARLNKSAEEVVIRRLDTKFGMRETIGEAKVYQAAANARDIEQDYMLVRNKIGPDGVVEDDAGDADADAATESPEAAEDEADDEAPAADEAGGDEADDEAPAATDADGEESADAEEEA